jgi:hypothetical protein
MENQIKRAIMLMNSEDDDDATSGVENAVSIGQDAVPLLLAAFKSENDGYSEKKYYLSKALGLIGDDDAIKGMLQSFAESKKQSGYKQFFNFF